MAEDFDRLARELDRYRAEHADEIDNGMLEPAQADEAVLLAAEEAEEAIELTFDEKYERLSMAVRKQPLNREPMYRALEFCLEEHVLQDIETYLETLPEWSRCTWNQYYLIRALERAYGLEFIERDEEGEIVTPERKEGLTEDEIDDLVATWNWKTTDVGAKLVEEQAPTKRVERLLEIVPERRQAYIDLLEFVQPGGRSYEEVKGLLKGRPELNTVIDGHEEIMQPSVFVDKLERAGALVYENGWKLTKEGEAYLAELKA